MRTISTMSAASEALDLEPVRPLLRADYDRLVEAGVFEDERIELIEGRLVIMSPEDAPHASVGSALTRLLVLALEGQALVRVGSPLAVSDVSEPEPDLAAVALGDHSAEHPQTAGLAIEGSHSSLRKDRLIKPALYAAAGIAEYWIVDLQARAVTVLTEPDGVGYQHSTVRHHGQQITLVAFPGVTFEVSAFLPE